MTRTGPTRRWLGRGLAAALALLGSSRVAQGQDNALPSFDVVHYDAAVEPDIEGRAVRGVVKIEFIVTAPSSAIEIDIGALTVDTVAFGSRSQPFTQGRRRLRVEFARTLAKGERKTLTIAYHGAPTYGLEFVPEKSQTYTIFSTSQWMPCIDRPDDRATLRLNLVFPKGLGVVANGKQGQARALADGRIRHEWRLDRPSPTYTFGFAAGRFNEATDRRGKLDLRYLATDATTDELQRIFADTKDMIAFFEDRAGVRYAGGSYTQALVARTIGQELTDFSLMSEEYGRSVLSDPEGEGLIAHELAHQWWGNRLTCLDWTHFWLNEGFATFMAAAYRERRFGREAYLRDVEGWRARYERVRIAGKDRSLVFPEWNRPTSDDRALVYQKGALVLHELRQNLGEDVFWGGIRAYTREGAGKSVVTADFRRAMERAARKDLGAFFDEWVYLKVAARH